MWLGLIYCAVFIVGYFCICYKGKYVNTTEQQLFINKMCGQSVMGEHFWKQKLCTHFCLMQSLHHEAELCKHGDHIKAVTRFLGLLLNNRRSFNSHVKCLKNRCLKVLDIIEVLTKTKWGADCTFNTLPIQPIIHTIAGQCVHGTVTCLGRI